MSLRRAALHGLSAGDMCQQQPRLPPLPAPQPRPTHRSVPISRVQSTFDMTNRGSHSTQTTRRCGRPQGLYHRGSILADGYAAMDKTDGQRQPSAICGELSHAVPRRVQAPSGTCRSHPLPRSWARVRLRRTPERARGGQPSGVKWHCRTQLASKKGFTAPWQVQKKSNVFRQGRPFATDALSVHAGACWPTQVPP